MSEPVVGATEQAPDLEMLQRREAVAEWFAMHIKPVAQELDTRDYQLDIWGTLADDREAGKVRELLDLATGLGKTAVAAVDTVKFRRECEQAEEPMVPRMLYVSHLDEINKQAAETFGMVMPDADLRHIDPSKGDELDESDVDFATIQGLYRNLDKFDPEAYEGIIWDEAHHTEAETYRAVREHFRPLYELAITATVDRMDGQDIREYFGEPVYSKGLAEAIAEGWLTKVDYHIVLDKAIKEAVEEGHALETLKDIKALFDEKPPRDVLAQSIRDEIEKLGLENPKTMVFCDSIAEADEMSELLGGVSLHSKSKDRSQKIEDFRSGRERWIFTKDLFNEGVDVPDVDLVVFLRPTGSEAIFLQQLGRGLRLSPGKEKVTVLDFAANIERIAKIRELSQAIEKRAGELQREISERSGERGLHVHAGDSDFDFDRIAVDLLERWGYVKERYSKENLTEQLLRKAQELGAAPTGREVKEDPLMADPSTYTTVFDMTWNEVLRSVGLTPTRDYNYTQETLTELLLQKAETLGRTPAYQEMGEDPQSPMGSTYIRIFGVRTWNEVLKEVGLPPLRRRDYSAEELTAQLLDKAEELGRTPSQKDITKDPSMAGYNSFLGAFNADNWNDVLRKVDLPIIRGGDYSVDELTQQLLQKAEEIGRTPTANDIKTDPDMAPLVAFTRTFDAKWSAILEIVGLGANKKSSYTRDELTAQLRQKAEELGRAPTGPEVNGDPEMASTGAFTATFGMKWNEVIKDTLGLHGKVRRDYTKAELTQQLLHKAEELGRTPIGRDINADPEMAGLATFVKIFDMSLPQIIETVGLPPAGRRRKA